MNVTFHKANTRGLADHGWLKSRHTFSFASYHNPKRMNFGTLRVINDDSVAAANGFGTHPHQNMEIISIPLKGALKHVDTMGNETIIRKGEVQAMSAGTGLLHSEFNNSNEEEVHFLQIWVLPEKLNIEPRYSQKEFTQNGRDNQFQLIVSPDGRENSVVVNQQAYFSLLSLEEKKDRIYQKYQQENGVYFFVLDGDLKVKGHHLEKRDGLGLEQTDDIEIKSHTKSELLIMEVPFI